MIDLIIPVYKNLKGLRRTLDSINYSVFKVTIVEDGTNEVHGLPHNIKVFKLKKNVGPGQARQYGIDNTFNDYIMFIDAGDVFLSKDIQKSIESIINLNPQENIFSWLYYYKDELTSHIDNRLHGKIYKRKFLHKYDIVFSQAGSYLDEDIGFNRTCRIISNYIHKPFYCIDRPVIQWMTEEDSITQKDNNRSLYEKQSSALSINSMHCISCCRKNNIPENYIRAEINEIAGALYYWFIRTAAERPEYLNEAWKGARLFYTRYEKEIDISTIFVGSARLKKCLQYRDKINFRINIIRFARDILIFKEVPPYYLTKSKIMI